MNCRDCGARNAEVYLKDKWGQNDLRSAPRCAVCAVRHEQNVAYKRLMFVGAIKEDCLRRDVAMTRMAERAPRKDVKVCPNCHARRHKDSFIKGSGMYGHCQLCRDVARRLDTIHSKGEPDSLGKTIAKKLAEKRRDDHVDAVLARLEAENKARQTGGEL